MKSPKSNFPFLGEKILQFEYEVSNQKAHVEYLVPSYAASGVTEW